MILTNPVFHALLVLWYKTGQKKANCFRKQNLVLDLTKIMKNHSKLDYIFTTEQKDVRDFICLPFSGKFYIKLLKFFCENVVRGNSVQIVPNFSAKSLSM